jgi:hypothetical protein
VLPGNIGLDLRAVNRPSRSGPSRGFPLVQVPALGLPLRRDRQSRRLSSTVTTSEADCFSRPAIVFSRSVHRPDAPRSCRRREKPRGSFGVSRSPLGALRHSTGKAGPRSGWQPGGRTSRVPVRGRPRSGVRESTVRRRRASTAPADLFSRIGFFFAVPGSVTPLSYDRRHDRRTGAASSRDPLAE